LKDLERENARLKRLVAVLALEKQILQDFARGKLVTVGLWAALSALMYSFFSAADRRHYKREA
jgi:hypothetical protein